MQKKDIIEQITNARLAHLKWVRRAKHLIEKLPVSSGMIPIDATECTFGAWLYREGLKYKNLSQLSTVINKIEKLHTEIHDIYLDIYKIYFVDLKRSWVMSKILDAYKDPTPQQQKMAYRYFIQLEDISVLLMQEFDLFERTLKNIDIEDLKRVL